MKPGSQGHRFQFEHDVWFTSSWVPIYATISGVQGQWVPTREIMFSYQGYGFQSGPWHLVYKVIGSNLEHDIWFTRLWVPIWDMRYGSQGIGSILGDKVWFTRSWFPIWPMMYGLQGLGLQSEPWCLVHKLMFEKSSRDNCFSYGVHSLWMQMEKPGAQGCRFSNHNHVFKLSKKKWLYSNNLTTSKTWIVNIFVFRSTWPDHKLLASPWAWDTLRTKLLCWIQG